MGTRGKNKNEFEKNTMLTSNPLNIFIIPISIDCVMNIKCITIGVRKNSRNDQIKSVNNV